MPLMLAIAAAIVKRMKPVPTMLLKVRIRTFGLATVLYRNLHHILIHWYLLLRKKWFEEKELTKVR